MAQERIITGIDVGTYQVKVVVVRMAKNKNNHAVPQIIGTGISESRGLRNGYIINETDVIRSVRSAVSQAEKTAGLTIKKAFLATGSIGLDEVISTGEVITSRADSEITDIDVDKVTEDSEDRIIDHIPNRRILNTIPLRYRIDGEDVMGKPQGMTGTKLEVDTLFITTYEQHLDSLISAIEKTGIAVEDVTSSPAAASLVVLNKLQKRAGCVLANIGSETTSIIVYEDMIPVSVKVFPIGANDITNDIALGLKITLEEAEKVKRNGVVGTPYSRKKLEEIINARLTDIFELIQDHLKKIKRDGLLPAGIVLIGGGSNTMGAVELAKNILVLPAKVSHLDIGKNSRVRDSIWAVAFGLCMLGFSNQEETSFIGTIKPSKSKIIAWFSQFIP